MHSFRATTRSSFGSNQVEEHLQNRLGSRIRRGSFSRDSCRTTDKLALKQSIIPLLVSISTNTDGRPPAPTNVRSQLEEAIALVAERDFPHDWPNLMDDLVPKLADQDDQLVLGILRTAHTIFYRWRSAFRSDDLYTEINYVLTNSLCLTSISSSARIRGCSTHPLPLNRFRCWATL